MAATELRLAVARQLRLAVLMFCDGSLNRIELEQQAFGCPSTATRPDDIDMGALAGAMGCDGVRVTSVAALEKARAGLAGLTRPLRNASYSERT
ncbi:thiamine pyrophosphate-dependent enzyme [Streptomyces sp. QTS52]